jgi:hypothetical protein
MNKDKLMEKQPEKQTTNHTKLKLLNMKMLLKLVMKQPF